MRSLALVTLSIPHLSEMWGTHVRLPKVKTWAPPRCIATVESRRLEAHSAANESIQNQSGTYSEPFTTLPERIHLNLNETVSGSQTPLRLVFRNWVFRRNSR